MKINQWLKLAEKVWRSNRGSLNRPYKLTYVVTKRCHSRCKYCDIWKASSENELSIEEITLFAKNSPFLSWIDFTGGEPTDRAEFPEIVGTFLEHSKDLLLIHFPTNGLRPDHIVRTTREVLKRSSAKLVVTVSIDGPPKINEELRGLPGSFELAVETFAKLKEMGVEVYAGLTLFPENMKLIEEMAAEIKKHCPAFDYGSLHVNLPNVSEHFYGNQEKSLEITKEMTEVMFQLMKQRGIPLKPFSWLERIYQFNVKKYLETGKCPLDCAALMASCFLAEDGTVFPCSIWNKPLGNIREANYKLEPLLSSQRALDLREILLKKGCLNCWTPCEAYQTIFANWSSLLLRKG